MHVCAVHISTLVGIVQFDARFNLVVVSFANNGTFVKQRKRNQNAQ